jgi:hypothetical protein
VDAKKKASSGFCVGHFSNLGERHDPGHGIRMGNKCFVV